MAAHDTPRPVRSRFVKVRAEPGEERRWRAAAEARGMNFSEWVRALADDAAATGGTGRELAAAVAALRADIGRGIGNNINQLAHVANMGGGVSPGSLDAAAKDVQAMRKALEQVLRAVRPPRAKVVP